jgi:hypothetical protein
VAFPARPTRMHGQQPVRGGFRAGQRGYTAEGILDLTGGGKAHYNAISRAFATPGGGFKVTEEINLVLLQ